MNNDQQGPVSPYLEQAFFGVYIGLFSGLILGAIILGVRQYFQEKARWPYDIDGVFVVFASVQGAGVGAIVGASVGLGVGLLKGLKMKAAGG